MLRISSLRVGFLVVSALVPALAAALNTTNSDSADLVLADMALSRGDCRGGTDRYLRAALATDDAKISARANKVASDCQQIDASARGAVESEGQERLL